MLWKLKQGPPKAEKMDSDFGHFIESKKKKKHTKKRGIEAPQIDTYFPVLPGRLENYAELIARCSLFFI